MMSYLVQTWWYIRFFTSDFFVPVCEVTTQEICGSVCNWIDGQQHRSDFFILCSTHLSALSEPEFNTFDFIPPTLPIHSVELVESNNLTCNYICCSILQHASENWYRNKSFCHLLESYQRRGRQRSQTGTTFLFPNIQRSSQMPC